MARPANEISTRAQYRILFAIGLVAVFLAVLSLWMNEAVMGLAALVAVLSVTLSLLVRGFSVFESNTSPGEYFGARSQIASKTTLQSLGSSWVMLGNVVVAGMILGQIFGAVACWVVVTWSLAFVLMSNRVDRVRSVLSAEDTLHSFLHRTYGSRKMQRVAAVITVFVGIGVFSMELLAGIALLVATLPVSVAAIAAPLMILLLVLAMCIAAIAGGLRAVITTDALFWPVVILGVGLLLAFSISHMVAEAPGELMKRVFPAALDGWGLVAFCLGVAALQIPLLLADYGTWQRVKAAKPPAEGVSLATYTLRQAGWQFVLWLGPVIAGIALVGLPPLYEAQSGNLYASSFPLIEAVRHWIAESSVPLLLRTGCLFVFITAMLAVMVSTANTYLLIAMETWVRDFRPKAVDDLHPDEDAVGRDAVATARIICILLGLIACLPILVLVQLQINLVAIIVIVFSVQVALAPAAVLALYYEQKAKPLAHCVVLSTIAGFIVALAYGVITSYAVTGWWRDYGSFLTALVALGVPTVAISTGLRRKGAQWKDVGGFLKHLLWPFG